MSFLSRFALNLQIKIQNLKNVLYICNKQTKNKTSPQILRSHQKNNFYLAFTIRWGKKKIYHHIIQDETQNETRQIENFYFHLFQYCIRAQYSPTNVRLRLQELSNPSRLAASRQANKA